ncbi:MAG: hypothetical protein HY658_07450 [Actinobacteria bacterium]|nr:hypothetical protein [Actinomycetota bacterium]
MSPVRLARIGGVVTVATSVVVAAVTAAVSHMDGTAVGVLAFAALPGALALSWPGRVGVLMTADLLLVVALVPMLWAWVFAAYLPALAVMALGTVGVARQEEQ